MNRENIQNLTLTEIEAMVCQLEYQYDKLQEEYLQKKHELLNNLALLRNRMVVDDLMKRLGFWVRRIT